MNTNRKINSKKYYWYGIFTIIPILGLIIGILLFRKGLLFKNRKICFIGTFGILVTIFFFIGGLYYPKYSVNGKQQRAELTLITLKDVMRDVEFYKLKFGIYPDSLNELKLVDKYVFIKDPLSQKGIFSRKLEYFYYKKTDSMHYTLFSAGLDQKPYTQDDLYPVTSIPDFGKLGLVKAFK